MAGITGIDHPVIAIRDMNEARARYKRLGFNIPPRGSHLEWGTGNWCVMFAQDYLELRGIIDPTRYTHHLDTFLARREGLLGIAFSSESAREFYKTAAAAGLSPVAPQELTRRFDLLEGDAFPRFRLVFFGSTELPGLMRSLVCEHLTPELIRRPEWLLHPNGVTSIADVTAVVSDPPAVCEAYARLFGDGHIRVAQDGFVVQVGATAQIIVLTPSRAAREGLALEGLGAPYLAAIKLRVSELSVTKALLESNGVAFRDLSPGTLRVSPSETCGVVLDFSEEAR